MSSLKLVFELLTRSERKRAVFLLCMILTMALLDAVGVASIMPFIAVLANPQLVETNALLAKVYETFNFTSTNLFLFSLGLLVFILLVLSLSLKAVTNYAQLRYTLVTEYSLSRRLVEGYLRQPYSWYLSKNSAVLGKNVLSEVSEVINQVMMPLLVFIAQFFVAFALLSLLMFIDPQVSLTVGVVLGIAYGLVYKLVSKYLSRIGVERVVANEARFHLLSEAFGAIKDVKIRGLEQTYVDRFSIHARTYAINQASAQIVAQVPRFILEMIAFGGMLLLVLVLIARNGSFTNAVPIISLYAFAGYRLIPALQQIYGSYTQLRFSTPALKIIHQEILGLQRSNDAQATVEPLRFSQDIKLDDVYYSYPNTSASALKGLDISIASKTTVGIVGFTGSGKTSTIDILLGLLEPEKGAFLIDGVAVDSSNRRHWQKTVGYVPQQIYLTDDSVYANIAFGIEPENVDHSAIERAAKIANLHDFVINEMPEGYESIVGERGVRLSGGQRQRIGIARALYHNPNVLILDEATSALDNLTEKAVMDAVHNLGHEITVILVAHRLSTVRECDQIFLLEKGQLKAQGTFDELLEDSETFRAMATK